VARVTMNEIFIVAGRAMMLFAIAVVVLVVFGLFAWRYEAANGGPGGIVKLLHDRLTLARSRDPESAQRKVSRR
jgi:hypothetical protein